MRTSNVVLRKMRNFDYDNQENATMTGVGIKSIILLFICLVSACVSIILFNLLTSVIYFTYAFAIIGTVVFQIIITINPKAAKSLSIPYVICEGLTIGVLCALVEYVLPGEGFAIAVGALIITLGIVLACCILYSHAGIRAKSNFIKFFLIILLGISIASVFFALTALFTSLFAGISLWSIYLSSKFSIIVSVIMVFIAAIYIFITIQNTDEIVNYGMNKEYEWYAGFGLAVSVIWLFLEVLELLLKIVAKSKRD